jgi:hypothetical protein
VRDHVDRGVLTPDTKKRPAPGRLSTGRGALSVVRSTVTGMNELADQIEAELVRVLAAERAAGREAGEGQVALVDDDGTPVLRLASVAGVAARVARDWF